MASLRGQTAANLVTIAASVAVGFLLSVVAARAWPLEEFATYLYLSWLAGSLGLLAAAAFPALAVRLVAESLGREEPGRARRLLARLVGSVALSGLAVCLALLAVEAATGLVDTRGLALPVVVLALGQALSAVLAHGTQGARAFDLVLLASLPTSVLAAVLSTSLILRGFRAPAVLLALGVGHLCLAGVLGVAFPRRVRPGPDRGGPRLAEIRPYFLVVSALGLIDLVVWQKSELFFLRRLASAEDVAFYSTSFQLAVAATRMAPAALAGVLTPAFATLGGRGGLSEARGLFVRAAAVMAALSAGLGLAGLCLGRSLLGCFGPAFPAAFPLLPWLLVGLGAGNVSGVASAVFHGFGRADLLLKMGAVLAVTNLGLDVALIPLLGAQGAAMACSLAQLLSLPVAALLVRRAFDIRFPASSLLRLAVAAAVPAVTGEALRPLLPLAGVGADAAVLALSLAGALACFTALGGARLLARPVEVRDPEPPVSPAPPVSVVIPTKNRPDYLRRAVRQVLEQTGPAREVLVVDSSDGDESARLLAAEFPAVGRIQVRGMPNNRHFAKNQGIRLARGAIVCFLDDDSFVEPGWLEGLLRHYERPEVGSVGGRIIDEVFGRSPTGEIVGGLEPNGRLHLNFTRHTGKPVEVEHLIGCNMSFRASVLARVGGFDLAYGGPNFMEETDLCLRVRRAGYRIVFDPDALVYHANAPRDGGLRREPLDPRGEFWSARSRAYFALKLLPPSPAVLRYNLLGLVKLHLEQAIRRRSPAHLNAAFLQALGSLLGTYDWLAARCPRVEGP